MGFLPIQYPWLHFPFISHLVMVSVGCSLKVGSDVAQATLARLFFFFNSAMSGLSGSMWDLLLQLMDSSVVIHGLNG